MGLNLKKIILSSLLIANSMFAGSKYLEYKMDLFIGKGSFIYKEEYNKEKDESHLNGEMKLSLPLYKMNKEYKTIIDGDKTFYWENDIFEDNFYVNSWGTDFLTTLRIFMKHVEGDSLEKHPLFQDNGDIFQVYVDGKWREINSSCLKKTKIDYNGKEMEAYYIPFHGPNMKTEFDFFVYDKKIIKIKIKTKKIPFSLWGELQENKE